MSWKDEFDDYILHRGYEYYKKNQVEDLEIDGNIVNAVVEGSETYSVRIEMNGDDAEEMECDCPYAARGYNCKHMAAVLYAWEREQQVAKSDFPPAEKSAKEAGSAGKGQDEIRSLVNKIPEEDLRSILTSVLHKDNTLRNQLQMKYDFKMDKKQMKQFKKELDRVVRRYADPSGYVDWRNASGFCNAMEGFLNSHIPSLIEHACYMEAFQLVNQVFHTFGTTEMDDSDGNVGWVAETCCSFWKEIYEKADQTQKQEIKKWFRKIINSDTNYVIDDLMDYMEEFYIEYCQSEEEMRQSMEMLDDILEQNKDRNDCGQQFSMINGREDVILKRIELMRKLGMTDEEILHFRAANRHFYTVRELEVKEALESGNTEQAIQILEESKELDREYPDQLEKYIRQLINLYETKGDSEHLKDELILYLLNYYQPDMTCYHKLKMCISDSEEWKMLCSQIIARSKNMTFTLDLLVEEKEFDLLMEKLEKINSISTLEKYEKHVEKRFPKRVISIYADYVLDDMDRAYARTQYIYLVGYLSKIRKIEGGEEEAKRIANLWRKNYKRRSALMDEMNKAGF